MRGAFAGHWRQTSAILLIALALRLFFALACPHVAGDSPIYEAFARNLVNFRTYSHLEAQNAAAPRPTLIRVPGYPLLLAATFVAAGQGNETAVRVVQAFLDTFTCLLIALIGFEISSGEERRRRRVTQYALLLSALCPFCANYAATILTEVPAILLWTAATLFGLRALKQPGTRRNWFYCGLMTGGATLFRPESGILVGIFGLVLLVKQVWKCAWKPILSGGILMSTGLILVLIPWTARNALTLRTFQFLAPTYAQDVGETVPSGYFDWCRTWLWKYHEIELYLFPLGEENLPVTSPPPGSADNDARRQTVLKMIKRHNEEGDNLDAAADQTFESIAGENRRRHPVRYYLGLPFLRSVAMWFTPRVEILGLEGWLLPLSEAWENDPVDFSLSLLLFIVNVFYLALSLWGAVSIARQSQSLDDFQVLGCFTLLAITVLRTLFFAYFAFPEPRYVLEAYPELIVLGAFALTSKARSLKG